jgi:N-acetylmuramoyl-L-alanine amidase
MNSKLNRASQAAVAATLITAMLGAVGSGAAAQALQSEATINQPVPEFISEPVVQALPALPQAADEADGIDAPAARREVLSAPSLPELVAAQPQSGTLSPEMNCLAGAIYFEANGESLVGQLAVGRVIVARSKSGRFPSSYCGVVYQPSQFSFVRGRTMPAIPKGSAAWRRAVAVARIAHDGSWQSPAEGALFFHATYVSPGWRLTRMARVDRHVFYR